MRKIVTLNSEPLRSKIADWVTIASVGQLAVKYFITYTSIIEVEFLMKYFHIWPEILAAFTVAVFIFSKIYFRKTATLQSPVEDNQELFLINHAVGAGCRN